MPRHWALGVKHERRGGARTGDTRSQRSKEEEAQDGLGAEGEGHQRVRSKGELRSRSQREKQSHVHANAGTRRVVGGRRTDATRERTADGETEQFTGRAMRRSPVTHRAYTTIVEGLHRA